jgi:hypothetical protein
MQNSLTNEHTRRAASASEVGGGGAELVAKDSCDSPKSPNESIIMQ